LSLAIEGVQDTVIMKDEVDNENLLIQYLLGNLPEEQRLQIEGEYLRDDQRYERLMALETELFYDYARNNLSPGERAQFEKQFLSSGRNRKRVMLASALARKLSEAAPAETTEEVIVDRERRFWSRLKSSFAASSAAKRVSLAALAIMSFASIWLVIEIVRVQNKFDQFRAQWAVQEDRLQQLSRQERARADELNFKLEREMSENAALQQQLSKTRAPIDPSVVSLVLAPSIVRDQAPAMKKLHLPPGAGLVMLRLILKGEIDYKSYQVMLLTAEGAERWSHTLQAQRTGSGRSIVLSLPTKILAEGDYELRLKGYAPDGTMEETGDYYYLSVVRR
jgi:anti-sigma factor RsiW